MNTIVMSLGQEQCQHISQQLKHCKQQSPNPYVRFLAKIEGTSVTIYTSGKVVFQGRGAEQLAKTYGYQPEMTTQQKPVGQNSSIIGTDEVGNGSYFGGIAVVASFVTPEQHDELRRLGVGDSKTLTDQKIRQIAPLLEQQIPHKALLLSPSKYNQVVGEGKRHNAVSVKVALHNQAIYLLLKTGITPDKIVIDAFTSYPNYHKYLKAETNQFPNPIHLEEKAEGQYLAVAVSSIIARNLFLTHLEQLSQEIGYILPSGAGAKSDKVASQIIQTMGLAGLEYTAKYHFKNTQKAIALAQQQ